MITKSAVKIETFKAKDHLAEIYGSPQMTFSFLSAPKEGNKQCCLPVRCRDFLQDAIRATLTKKPASIYGFKFDYEKNPKLDILRTRMLINIPKERTVLKTADKIIEDGLKLIHYYENLAGIVTKTTVKSNEEGYVVVGSNFWMFSPAVISLYTLLFRLGEYDLKFETDKDDLVKAYESLVNKKETYSDYAIEYLREVYKVLEDFVRYYKLSIDGKKFDNIYYEDIPIRSFHGNSGIVSFCNTNKDGLYKEQYAKFKDYIETSINVPSIVFPYGGFAYVTTHYASNNLYFGLLNAEDKIVTESLDSCREVVCSRYRYHLTKNKGLTKTKLLVTASGILDIPTRIKNFKEKIFFAKRFVNHFEKQANIPLSKISLVFLKSNSSKIKQFSAILTGDAAWVSSPVMLSTYIFLLRVSFKTYEKFENKDNITDENIAKAFDIDVKPGLYKVVISDQAIFKGYIDQIKLLMVERKTLFLSKEPAINFLTHADNVPMNSSKVGVVSLLKKTTIDKTLLNKYEELLKTCQTGAQ